LAWRLSRSPSTSISLLVLPILISRPPANKPKPNTRFLRNIIKDTDSHNAALLAKEAAESRARLQSLAGNEHRERKASRVGGGDIRRRQLGDIAAILGGGPPKRRKIEDSRMSDRESKRVDSSGDEDGTKRKSSEDRKKKYRSREEDIKEGKRSRSHRSHRHRSDRSISKDREKDKERRRRHRSRSRSPREERGKESKYRDRSPKRRRSRSREGGRREKSHRSHRRRRSMSVEDEGSDKGKAAVVKVQETKPVYDSDPLDDIIGPRPPPLSQIRSKGRGTMSHASGIDSRFSANYDPTTDVQLDLDEENDWDQALEALRDRQKWKQQGADRLRAAGFTDEEIKKWEKGGEKRQEDVRWAKRGEGREWDRGKVIDEDGIVGFESNFGRLKDA
jgi:hypothetical protein